MKKQSLFVLIILVSLSVFTVGQASALLIDFGAALPGAPTGPNVILTTQLASLGTTFSTTDTRGVVWHGPTGLGAYPYVISAGGVCGSSETCSNLPIRVDIDSSITGAFSDVSIRGFDGGADIDTMVMNAFDSLDILLDTTTLVSVYTYPGFVSTVLGTTIAYVTFEVTGTTNSLTAQHGLFFDDLCIGSCTPDDNQVPVPEPGTMLLLGTGLIGLAYSRRKLNK